MVVLSLIIFQYVSVPIYDGNSPAVGMIELRLNGWNGRYYPRGENDNSYIY